jgi:hypothetical protein
MKMVNGRPYFSTSQFPAANDHGIAAFPSIAPKTPEEPVVVINAKLATAGGPLPGSGTVNIQGFCINTNLTIAYLVDVRSQATGGGIHRYNGTGTGLPGSWTYAYTITNDVSVLPNVIFFMHIVADFSGANPILYATGGAVQGTTADASATNLVSTIDTGLSNPTFTFLAASDPGTAFRGLTFAPNPVSLSIVKSGSNIIISLKGGGSLLSSSVVTGPFLPVAGSPTSPYTNAISGTAQFYGVGFP